MALKMVIMKCCAMTLLLMTSPFSHLQTHMTVFQTGESRDSFPLAPALNPDHHTLMIMSLLLLLTI
jgi:hypothetical protein